MLGQEFLALEPREAPAVDLGAGNVWIGPNVVRHAFEDAWAGPLNLYETAEKVYVGAGNGGGPRVQVYDRGGRLLENFFAGDPGSRAGVYFVPTDPPPTPAPVLVPVPAITLGDLTDPEAFLIYVDWERPPDAEYVRQGMGTLTAALPVPGLIFTTVRPSLAPHGYGTIVVGADLSYDDRGPAGLAYARWDDGQPYGVSEAVYASYAHTRREIVGDLIAHEIAHGFGWQHGDDGDFRDDLDVVLHGVDLAKVQRDVFPV
jgi:hypothetical protein